MRWAGCFGPAVVAVDHPFEAAGNDVDEEAMGGDGGAEEGAVLYGLYSAEDILPLAGEESKVARNVVREFFAGDADRAEAIDQLRHRGAAHAAVAVADDGDLAAA